MKIGDKKNRLTLVSVFKQKRISPYNGKVRVDKIGIFKCTCGNTKNISISLVSTGNTGSCGCLKRELVTKKNITHGFKGSPEYRAWQAMKTRCYNSNIKEYKNYGGRNIKVCDAWLNSFEQFYKDVGPRPSPKHSIDRIDNDGNYEPSNVRWATIRTQSTNRRNNHRLTAYGITQSISEWERMLKIPRSRIQSRLKKGWSEFDAIFQPKNHIPKNKPRIEQ